ncbi:hypothetical protein [Peristeroidobacter agariperforans]|uniref:hypothetical protein n=1 Tax=Peristeroidobacter agariperforans TaxID=268404 RepID=UPI00101C8DA9|nr:hypothetical protein [Peristeroidobacter agariperforans]
MRNIKKMAMSASLIWTVFSASSAVATTCGIARVSQRELKASHIVASGTIVVLSEEIEYPSDEIVLIKGTAELRVESISRNRTSLTAPFRFTFQYQYDGYCTAGDFVYDGQFAIVHLKRPSRRATVLTVVKVESP